MTPAKEVSDGALALRLARAAVTAYVESGTIITPSSIIPESLHDRAPAFVTLRKLDALRGCIGTTEPKWPTLAHEIIMNAIAAASQDPRFPPVEAVELDHLSYEVDILMPLEPVASEADLSPERYGVMVEALGRRGLLLPAIEGIRSVEQQVAVAKRKAGLPLDATVRLFRFEVERFREEP